MEVRVGKFDYNRREFERFLREVMDYAPELVVFPEYFLTGFKMWDFSSARLYRTILDLLKEAATSFNVYIAAGVLEVSDDCVYNSAVLVSPNGRVILKHRKFQEPMRFCRGEKLEGAETPWGKVAMIICGDLYNDRIAEEIKRVRPDYLLVPMEYSPPYGPLNEKDIEAMSQKARTFKSTMLVTNAFPPGGAWIFDRSGKLLSSSQDDTPLLVEAPS